MAKFIELEEIGFHAVVFKMCRNNIGVRIVRRMLHGAEVRHIHILRYYHQPARMLPCCALDADQAERQPVFFCLCGFDAALIQIFFHITVGCFLCKCTNGSSTENMV